MAPPKLWTREMVEQTIKYFSDPKHDEKNKDAMKELVSDFVKFEQVVGKGLINPAGMSLAKDFVTFGQDWIRKNKLEKVYAELKK